MVSIQYLYARAYMQALAGEHVALNPSLAEIFARILSRQLEQEDNDIQFKSAFELMSKVFTFVATPPGSEGRPLTPGAYPADRLTAAELAARQVLQGTSDELVLHHAQNHQEPQHFTGTNGVRDIFAFDITSDVHGPFVHFGQSLIEGYNLADGDLVLFIDQGDFWADTDAMLADTLPEVQPHDNNALILLNGYPVSVDPSLQILGATLANPAGGNSLGDIENVQISLVTHAAITLAGGLQAYVETSL